MITGGIWKRPAWWGPVNPLAEDGKDCRGSEVEPFKRIRSKSIKSSHKRPHDIVKLKSAEKETESDTHHLAWVLS